MMSEDNKKRIYIGSDSVNLNGFSNETQTGVYIGSRGSDFKELIKSVLRKGNLNSKYINMLTDDESMSIYGCAFTSELVDPDNNYQVLEQIGDLSGNKFIVNYMYERFPQLDCCDGVKVVARLRINYGAKESFCEIARKLGFWSFISATKELRQRKMKSLLEDVFEAFIGATERIVDKRKRVGVGYAVVHDILTTIFNDIDISLKYDDLYDSKTRLKELFDTNDKTLGKLVYKENKTDHITVSTVYRVENPNTSLSNYIKIGDGSASLKSDAQQKAATVSLVNLSKQGWYKSVPVIYQKFNNKDGNKCDKSDIEVLTPDSIKKIWGSDMQILHITKQKSKYQSKYESTPLSVYCRSRNVTGIKHCLDLGADPNVQDTEGMYPIDLLFIGKRNETLIEDILILMLKKGHLKMTRLVYEVYFKGYIGNYFDNIKHKLLLVE